MAIMNRVLSSPKLENSIACIAIALTLTPCLLAFAQDKAAPEGPPKIEKMRTLANTNARALATAVQARAIANNKYDSKLADYAVDLGGSIPINPCTGTTTGYAIKVKAKGKFPTATVAALKGTKCGKWVPTIYSLTL